MVVSLVTRRLTACPCDRHTPHAGPEGSLHPHGPLGRWVALIHRMPERTPFLSALELAGSITVRPTVCVRCVVFAAVQVRGGWILWEALTVVCVYSSLNLSSFISHVVELGMWTPGAWDPGWLQGLLLPLVSSLVQGANAEISEPRFVSLN